MVRTVAVAAALRVAMMVTVMALELVTSDDDDGFLVLMRPVM